MRMPFAKIVKSPIVVSGAIEELPQLLSVQIWIAAETGVRTGRCINTEVDDAKSSWLDLLGKEHSADFTRACAR